MTDHLVLIFPEHKNQGGNQAPEKQQQMEAVMGNQKSTGKIEFKVAKMFVLPDAGSLKAFADVLVNDALIIKGLKIIEGKKGIFITMPREQGKDSKWYDQVSCLSADVFEDISRVVIAEYDAQTLAVA